MKKTNLESKGKIGLAIVTENCAVTRNLRLDSAESKRSRWRNAVIHYYENWSFEKRERRKWWLRLIIYFISSSNYWSLKFNRTLFCLFVFRYKCEAMNENETFFIYCCYSLLGTRIRAFAVQYIITHLLFHFSWISICLGCVCIILSFIIYFFIIWAREYHSIIRQKKGNIKILIAFIFSNLFSILSNTISDLGMDMRWDRLLWKETREEIACGKWLLTKCRVTSIFKIIWNS